MTLERHQIHFQTGVLELDAERPGLDCEVLGLLGGVDFGEHAADAVV